MSLIKLYNDLNGRKVKRIVIQKLHRKLFDKLPEENPLIETAWKKLGKLLENNPKATHFELEVTPLKDSFKNGLKVSPKKQKSVYFLIAKIYQFPNGYVEEERWKTDEKFTITKSIENDINEIKEEYGAYSPVLIKRKISEGDIIEYKSNSKLEKSRIIKIKPKGYALVESIEPVKGSKGEIPLSIVIDNQQPKEKKTKGLKGIQHKGIERIALNNCGRLNKGFKYEKGGLIVQTEESKKYSNKKKKVTKSESKNYKNKLGYALVDNVSGSIVASKKSLSELKEVFIKSEKNDLFSESPALVYEIIKRKNKNVIGKKINVNWQKKKISNNVAKSHKARQKKGAGLNGDLKPVSNLVKRFGFKAANETPKEAEGVFTLPGEVGKFLQNIQPHKALILIKGTKHTSKSQLAMRIANAFGEMGWEVPYIDYEQGGLESKDTVDSINRNTTKKGRKNIYVIGYLESPLENLEEIAKTYNVLIADSVTDLKITADQLNYLRNKYPETIWIFISQVKENGTMYGGNKMAHNPTAIIHIEPNHDYTKRIATLEKNRGNDLSIKYNIFEDKVLEPELKVEKMSVEL